MKVFPSLVQYGESVDLTLTFKSPEAYLRYNSYEDFPSINVSLEFRTYEPKGLLIYHKFSEEGYFKVRTDDSFAFPVIFVILAFNFRKYF
jgi:hypothetical protein